jgi:Calx-beta domain/Kelch motif
MKAILPKSFLALLALLMLVAAFGISTWRTKAQETPAQTESPQACSWVADTVYPTNIWDTAAVTIGSNLYVFGGAINGTSVAASNKFNGVTWTPIAPLPTARRVAAVVSDGTSAYIINGGSSSATNSLIRYNPASDTYTTLTAPSTATFASAAAFLNGKIYRIAGTTSVSEAGSISSVEVYTIASNSWAPAAPLPVAVSFLSAVAGTNVVYAGGGLTASGTDSLKTYAYDPNTNTWNDAVIADLPADPAPHWGAGSAMRNGKWVIGPGASGGNERPNAIEWDPSTNLWTNLPDALQARYRGTAAVLNNNYYAIGGAFGDPNVVTNNNQRLACTDNGSIQFSQSDYFYSETNVNNAVITVTRTGGSAGAVSVQYSTSNITATAGSDYTSVSNTLSWSNGDSTSKTFIVPITNDTIYESEETVRLTLSNFMGGAVPGSPNPATLHIVDNETPPSYSITSPVVTQNEGSNLGSTPFDYTVTRTFSPGTTGTAFNSTVSFAVFGSGVNPANASDFNGTTGSVFFTPAGLNTQTARVNVFADTIVEPNETFNIQLTGTNDGGTVSAATVGGTIVNDDTDISVVLLSPQRVFEDGAPNLVYRFTRSGVTTGSLTISYSFSGSATNGTDYTFSPATITFPAGVTMVDLTVNPTPDTIYELNETVTVTINSGSGYSIGTPSSDTGFIDNDETIPSFGIVPNPVTKLEGSSGGSTPFDYSVVRTFSGGTTGTALSSTVNYQVVGTGPNPANAADFVSTSGTVLFSPTTTGGSNSQQVTVNVIADPIFEADETFDFSLTGATNGITSISGVGGTIVNDDLLPCSIIPIQYGETVNGLLDSQSCLINGNRLDVYSFVAAPNDRIAITMQSADFFTRLELYGPNGAPVAQTTDGSAMNSRLPEAAYQYLTLSTGGMYTIRAIGRAGGIGGYSLALFQAPLTPCTYTLSTPQTNVPFTGGPASFDVLTQPGCPPSEPPFPSAVSGFFNVVSYFGGRVRLSVQPNMTSVDKNVSISINTPTGTLTHLLHQYRAIAPTNDPFGSPTDLISADSSTIGFNTLATAEPPSEPEHFAGNAAGASVWYRWTAPTTGLYTFSTAGSSFDTVMAVYPCLGGTCSLSTIGAIGSNDDTAPADLTSKVNFRAVGGTQYRIAIDGKRTGGSNSTGTIQLAWMKYDRLYRIYLQNFNGDPSPINPDSVTATNGVLPTVPATKISQGVYELSFQDNTTYVATVSGPADIAWDPPTFTLSPTAPINNFTVSTYKNPDGYPISGYMRNANVGMSPIAVEVGFSRTDAGVSTTARDPRPCNVQPTPLPGAASSAVYQCRSQPSSYHDIVPNGQNRRFESAVRSFPNFITNPNTPFVSPPDFNVFSDGTTTTYGIGGRIITPANDGIPDVKVNLIYTPASNGPLVAGPLPIGLRKVTIDSSGSYSFPNLPPGSYSISAANGKYIFPDPVDISIPPTNSTFNITGTRCTYEPSLVPSSIPGSGGAFEFMITANGPTCDWFATSVDQWVTVNSSGGLGGGLVRFRVDQNSGPARNVTISIDGRTDPIVIPQGNFATPTPTPSPSLTPTPTPTPAVTPSISPTPTPTPTPTVMPTPTPTVTPTPTPGVTPTPSPIFTPTPTPTPTPSPSPSPTPGAVSTLEGDIVDANGGPNGDGLILTNDLARLRLFVLGLAVPVNPSQFARADINGICGDGGINAADVTVIRQFILGTLIPSPTCNQMRPANSEPLPIFSEVYEPPPNSLEPKARLAAVRTKIVYYRRTSPPKLGEHPAGRIQTLALN